MGKNSKSKPRRAAQKIQSNLNDLVDKLLYCCSTQLSSFKEEWNNFLEIEKILAKITEIEKDIKPITYNRYDNLASFLTWCQENGAHWEGVKIEKIDGKDLGIIAEKDLKEGDLYLNIPRKLMISTKTAPQRLGHLVRKDVVLRAMPNVLLAFYLLIEACEPHSFWKPYISILPSTFNTILYFTREELEELQSSPTLAEAVNLRRSIARQYAYLYRLLQATPDLKGLEAKKRFTYDLYRWAVSCVMTRQNSIPSSRQAKEPSSHEHHECQCPESHGSHGADLKSLSLVPLWDLGNHELGKYSTDFIMGKDELHCFAMKEFKSNEEVTMFYGARPNSELFIHSGFVLPPNVENFYDSYAIKLGISNNDPLRNDKNLLCDKLGLPLKGVFLIQKVEDLLGSSLFNFCKVSTMDKDGLTFWLSKQLEAANEMESFKTDANLNKKARDFLQARLKLILKSYKTTEEEDETLISNDKLSENQRLAITMRLTEKKLLKGTLAKLNALVITPTSEITLTSMQSSEIAPASMPSSEIILASTPASEITPASLQASEIIPSSLPSSEIVPASLPVSENAAASLPGSEITPASLPGSEITPASLPSSEITPASMPASENAPASLPASEITPASMPASENASASNSASEITPASMPASENAPASKSSSEITPASLPASEIVPALLPTSENAPALMPSSENAASEITLVSMPASGNTLATTTLNK